MSEQVAAEEQTPVETPAPEGGDDLAAAVALLDAGESLEPVAEPEPTPEDVAEDAPAPEPEPEPEAAEDEPPPGVAKGWAAIKAAEKKNRAEQQRFKQERQEHQQELEQLKAEREKLAAVQGNFAKDPLAALESMGVTFEDLAQRVLNDGAPGGSEVARRTKAETEGTAAELKAEIKELREMVTRKEQAGQVDEYKGQIKGALASPEFELLSAYPNAEQEIFEYAVEHARETGQALPASEIAGILQEEWRAQLKTLSAHKAARAALGLGEDPDTTQEEARRQAAQGRRGAPRTLTNNLAAEPAKGKPDLSGLSEQDELEAAAALISPDAWNSLSDS